MKKETEAPRLITVGGREWRRIDRSTIKRDTFMVRSVEAAGISLEHNRNETPQQFGSRLLGQLLDGGEAFNLLGGLLSPMEIADTKWTPEQAMATAEFMSELTEPADKAIILDLMVSLLIGFFVGAHDSLRSSGLSLRGAEGENGRDLEVQSAASL